MRAQTILRFSVGFYIVLFFGYLFGPLVIMSITAFNSSTFPAVSPWDCLSGEWFGVLVKDDKIMTGLRNSLLIGAGVVMVAVPIGLAGALLLTQLQRRARSLVYIITISPILVPGVVLGISTLIFWERIDRVMLGDDFFYDGFFLTIIGQATFISAYTMLIFIARLQRFDPLLEEAALDLGATHMQAFRKILLPFLKPAIGSAAVLAFLASFENYNTTVFTIVSESTLTTVLASKVRYGINPSISSLAVIIIGLTLLFAVLHELFKRREKKLQAIREAQAPGTPTRRQRPMMVPVTAVVVVAFVALLGTSWVARGYSVNECKIRVVEEKRKRAEQLSQQRIVEARARRAAEQAEGTGDDALKANTEGRQYQSIFAPSNLAGQVDSDTASGEEKGAQSAVEANKEGRQYQSIFAPSNLAGQVDSDTSAEEKGTPGAVEANKEGRQYQNIFAPSNLKNQVDSSKGSGQ
jgi:spermidine/putrescine transport system permease protein